MGGREGRERGRGEGGLKSSSFELYEKERRTKGAEGKYRVS